ncbi:MAG: O-antigen ligase family protein [Prochlorotrichaceae cyanobacterium]|jgi:O-antigen ligase
MNSTKSLRPPEQLAWNGLTLGLILLPFSLALGLGCFLLILGWGLFFYVQDYRRRSLTWIWLGLIVLLILSTAQAQFPLDAVLGLANFIPFILLFIVLRELLQTPQQLLVIQRILAVSVLPLVLLGCGQLWGGWSGPVQWGWIIQWSLAPGGTPSGRMDSVFGYANIFASYLTLIFPFVLSFWSQSWQASPPSWWSLWADRCLWSITLGFAALGLLMTHSRNAWMIATLVWLTFALYLRWYRWLLLAFGGLVSVFWAAFGPVGRSIFQQVIPIFFWGRLNDQLYPDRPVAELRVTQWQFAWHLTLQRPWLGWGLRNFSPLYKAEMGQWLGHPHNFFLMMTAETGIPVLLGFCAIVGWIFAQAIGSEHRIFTATSSPTASCLLRLSTLLSFGASVLFHCFDITLFDARINLLNWLLLAAITGIPAWSDAPLSD